jgi:hypothetical protein
LHQRGTSRRLTFFRVLDLSPPFLFFPARADSENIFRNKSPVFVAATPKKHKTSYGHWCFIQREKTGCDRDGRIGCHFHLRRARHRQDKIKVSGD